MVILITCEAIFGGCLDDCNGGGGAEIPCGCG